MSLDTWGDEMIQVQDNTFRVYFQVIQGLYLIRMSKNLTYCLETMKASQASLFE